MGGSQYHLLRPHGPHRLAGAGAVRIVGVRGSAQPRVGSGFGALLASASIAKGRSAQWVYVPPSLLPELDAYVEIDRAEVIAEAQAAGRYKWRHAWVVEGTREPVAVQRVEGVVHKLNVVELDTEQRSHTLLDGPAGLEPVAF